VVHVSSPVRGRPSGHQLSTPLGSMQSPIARASIYRPSQITLNEAGRANSLVSRRVRPYPMAAMQQYPFATGASSSSALKNPAYASSPITGHSVEKHRQSISSVIAKARRESGPQARKPLASGLWSKEMNRG